MSDSQAINYNKEAFGYDINKPAALIAGIAFGIVMVLIFIRLCLRRTWWGLCLPIGIFCFSAGFFFRYVSALNPTELSAFLIEQLLLVISPAAFLAFNYILYGRFIAAFSTGREQYSLIPPRIVARIFIISDVVTFMVQGAGGGLESNNNGSANLGRIVLLTGIAVQTASYVLFYLLLLHSHYKFRKDDKFDEHNFPWRLMHVFHFSSVFIIIRVAYRCVELSENRDGFLVNHEAFFYVLDAIPLFFATGIYIFYWPGQLMEDFRLGDAIEMGSRENIVS